MSALEEKNIIGIGCMVTYTGRIFSLVDPRPEQVSIRDIAHHLSLQCRFNGATRQHHSTARHSLIVSAELRRMGESPEVQLAGLMHDAPEAYTGDLIRPMKIALQLVDNSHRAIEAFDEIDRRVWAAIRMRYSIQELTPIIHELDTRCCRTEQRDLNNMPKGWSPGEEPFPFRIGEGKGLLDTSLDGRSVAEAAFLSRFAELRPGVEVD